MATHWRQIPEVEGYNDLCFQRDNYLAISKWDGTYRTWEILEVMPDGSRKKIGGICSQMVGHKCTDETRLNQALGYLDSTITP